MEVKLRHSVQVPKNKRPTLGCLRSTTRWREWRWNPRRSRYQRISFLWSGLQPSGPEDWNAFYLPDDLIASELAAGREIVGLLMSPPAWANGTAVRVEPSVGA